jgi:ribosomal protein L15
LTSKIKIEVYGASEQAKKSVENMGGELILVS